MNKIRVALIGLGRIAYLLEKDRKREKPCTHAGTYLSFPDSFEICAGMDIDALKEKEFRELIPDFRFYGKISDLIDHEKPDVLSVCTPAGTHLEIFRQIKKTAFVPKLIWLEKPVEIDYKKASRLKKIQDQAGFKTLVNHERRYHPHYLKTKEIIESEQLGSLKSIRAVMWMKASLKIPPKSGTLLEDGTHLLDILLFLTNKKSRVISKTNHFFKEKKVEKWSYGVLDLDGIPVFFESGGDREYFHFELDLSFTRGRIRVGNGFFEVFEEKESPYYDKFRSLMPLSVKTEDSNMFKNLGKEIIEFFESAKMIHSTLEDSLEVMALIKKIYS